jgi:hypothetical protein
MMVLGSLDLYERKAIFYREQKKYHIFKNGIEFIVRAHQMKINLTIVTTGHVKMIVNVDIQDLGLQPTIESKTGTLVDVTPNKKGKYFDGSFYFTSVYSILLFSLLLISGVAARMNGRVCKFKGMVNLVSNVVSVFIMVVMSQVLVIQARRMDDTGQVRQNHSLIQDYPECSKVIKKDPKCSKKYLLKCS